MSTLENLIEFSADAGPFRYIPDIENISRRELDKHEYYIGSPCPYGHEIRDKKSHWCYHCAIKIQSNICGFDLNYLHNDYKMKYFRLWNNIEFNLLDPELCWNINLPGSKAPRRICFPSYRTFYSEQKAENITAHKAIYQCAWGDVGSLFVTRICGNPWCGNPLHMSSRWNRRHPPRTVDPFYVEFDAQKLMRISKAKLLKRGQEIIQEDYKRTISHPLDAKDTPDYDEG